MSEKIHRGKLKAVPDPLVAKYLIEPGIKSDIRYRFQAFVDCNKAHVLMLTQQKIISKEAAAQILRVNDELSDLDTPPFECNPDREDFYFNLEAYLIEKTDIEIGGQQHTARSRNDLYDTCARMAVRKAFFELSTAFNRLRQTLIDKATESTDAVFSGYTHMQPSEPITFAHYLSGILSALERDYTRLEHVYAGLNLCPLGSCSMGSTSWNIDRQMTSDLLGFDAPMDNSIDGVASRDFITDLLATLSLASNTTSRLCQDLYVWSTPDYGYVEVPDSCAVCSSIMPQKKNPWVLERIKAKAAHIEAALISALNVMKNVIFSHTEDICGETGAYLFAAVDEMMAICKLTKLNVAGLKLNREVMLEKAKRNFCTVTELANTLVRCDKVSFRTAHDAVAYVVNAMIEQGKPADEIGIDDINAAYAALSVKPTLIRAQELKEALDPISIVFKKACIGGTNPQEVSRQLQARQEQLHRDIALLNERISKTDKAKELLDSQTRKFYRS
ncbi:MAG: argininosuccinate lyase [Sutterellaceae bacterium]|nr:argininosuccinate lyase [Sutterellaceae bacterium]